MEGGLGYRVFRPIANFKRRDLWTRMLSESARAVVQDLSTFQADSLMGHHFVPQRYLRNFEDPNHPGFIWLHDKRGGPARLAPIAKVAQAKGFYSQQTEAILARQVEAPGNRVIRKLTNNMAIGRAERVQLAYYIGVMMKRILASHGYLLYALAVP